LELLIAVAVIAAVFLTYWMIRRRSRAGLKKAIAERDYIRQQLEKVEVERQRLIDDADKRGTMISVDSVLSHVEALRQSYLQGGRAEDARKVDRVIQEFRAEYGAEIPIAKAYELIQTLEGKIDASSRGG
jgi:F0F1-type ATP synthase membrane subunit b/b'